MSLPLINLVNDCLPDGGPFYTETNMRFLIVEPFNAISSIAYLIPAIYWGVKLKGRYKHFAFLALCLPFLFLGGVGSTLYHAFRNSTYLLFMDVFPIMIVTILVSVYFWIKILPKWYYVVLVLLPFAIARYLMYSILSSGSFQGERVSTQTAINITYFITGVMIFAPALILMIRQKFKNAIYIVVSCLFFMLGLFFREADSWCVNWLSMGTHWLWHISTAVGTWILGVYLYRLRRQEIENGTTLT